MDFDAFKKRTSLSLYFQFIPPFSDQLDLENGTGGTAVLRHGVRMSLIL